MGNILLGIQAEKMNHKTLEFACYMAKLSGFLLSAVFLENLVADEKPVIKKMYDGTYINFEVDENSDSYRQKMKSIDQNISLFEDRCRKLEINYRVYRDKKNPLEETLKEGRYADALILDQEISFNEHMEEAPTDFVKDILARTECPVIIAPKSFDGIEEILFAYDGSRSSVFAFKQFTYSPMQDL